MTSNPETFPAKILRTQRGKAAYSYESKLYPGFSYVYNINGHLKGGTTRVQCKGCDETRRRIGGVCTTNLVKNEHFLHDPDKKAHICIDGDTLYENGKVELRSLYNASSNYNVLLDSIQNNPNLISNLDCLPSVSNMKRVFLDRNKTQKRIFTINDIPADIMLDVQQEQQLIQRKDDFLFIWTKQSLSLLLKATTWTFDGTFHYSPDGYLQTYTLTACFHEYPDQFDSILIGVAFLKNKTKQAYKILFQKLLDDLVLHFGEFEGRKTVLMDNERAAMKAIKAIFGTKIVLKACLFHFFKNVREKAQEMGGVILQKLTVKWRCCLVGSCFLPENHQREVFNHLLNNPPSVADDLIANMDAYMTDVDNYWTPQIDYLNHFLTEGPWTTNGSEGLYRSFDSSFSRSQNRTFCFFVEEFRQILYYQVCKAVDLQLFLEKADWKLERRKSRSIIREKRIKELRDGLDDVLDLTEMVPIDKLLDYCLQQGQNTNMSPSDLRQAKTVDRSLIECSFEEVEQEADELDMGDVETYAAVNLQNSDEVEAFRRNVEEYLN